METRERSSINYNKTPPQSNQESSPTLSISSPTSNITRNQTLNHGFNLQKEHHLQPTTNPDPPNLLSQPPPPPPPESTTARPVVVHYRECLKNHAANMGAHVLDGCGEFMPSGEDNTPKALKCAACDCHRSFHRREVDGQPQSSYHMAAPPPRSATAPVPPPPSHRRYPHHHPMPPIMMAFGSANGAAAESSSEDLNILRTYGGMQLAKTSKKRFRTKFSQEQKDKMFDFAKKIGWKMQKQDEQEVLRFCNEVGLKKQVFKVWMHNNNQANKKKQL